MGVERDEVTKVAEDYYDSEDADRFYYAIWGGEDIHIGLYEVEGEPIRDASERTVHRMAEQIPSWSKDMRVLDCGAGYGGAARFLAREHGCKVTCLNLSDVQNARNREMTKAQGLDHLVDVVHGSFEEIPSPPEAFDVVWSQDAVLHSGHKDRTISQMARVLKPGGHLVMTDPMQADDCPPGVLDAVLARIHLDQMGSFALYRELTKKHGLEEVKIHDLTHQLVNHYSSVRQQLRDNSERLSNEISKGYIERMDTGLGHWIDGGKAGHLAWGIMHFRKPA